jgi:hypothetical protein
MKPQNRPSSLLPEEGLDFIGPLIVGYGPAKSIGLGGSTPWRHPLRKLPTLLPCPSRVDRNPFLTGNLDRHLNFNVDYKSEQPAVT